MVGIEITGSPDGELTCKNDVCQAAMRKCVADCDPKSGECIAACLHDKDDCKADCE